MKQRSPWLDVTVALRPGLAHWPGDPPFQVRWPLRMEKGKPCNLSVLRLCSHTGTHMDAPLHFLQDGQSLDRMPLEAVIGPARVLRLDARSAIRPDHLRPHHIRAGERLLLRTRNSSRAWAQKPFQRNFISISAEGAAYLAGRKVRTIGIDYLSVGGFESDGAETHRLLLNAGIWLIEGLDLSRVKPGRYDLICLPLKVLGSEGAPARAVLRRRS